MNIDLRPTQVADLELLFQFQLDETANYLAAFTPKDPSDKAAYISKWTRILSMSDVGMQSIWLDNRLCGSVITFMMEGDAEVSYWLDKSCWGQGIGTAALRLFLDIIPTRPLFGRTAFDNIGSQRVLEKCGFVKIGTDRGFANARQAEIEEFIYKLEATI